MVSNLVVIVCKFKSVFADPGSVLSDDIAKLPQAACVLVSGDFNVRLRNRTEKEKPFIGPHLFNKQPIRENANTSLAIELCANHDLLFAHTFRAATQSSQFTLREHTATSSFNQPNLQN